MPKNSPFLINIGEGLSMTLGLTTISSWDTDRRPKNPRAGTIGFNLQTSSIEYWDGTNWFAAEMRGN